MEILFLNIESMRRLWKTYMDLSVDLMLIHLIYEKSVAI